MLLISKGKVTIMKRILSVLHQVAGRTLDVYIFLLALSALLPVLAAVVAQRVVDAILIRETWYMILGLIGIETLIIVARVCIDQVIAYISEKLRFTLIQGIQIRNAQQSASLDIEFYEDADKCNLLHRIRQESYHRPMMLLGSLSRLLAGVITTFGFFVVIAAWQPLLAIVFLIGMLPLLKWGQTAAGSSWSSHDLSTTDGRWAAYFDDLLSEREAAKEVRLYNLAPVVIPRLKQHDTQHHLIQMKGIRQKTIALIPGRVAGVVAQYASYCWAAYQVIQGMLSVGQFTLVIAALATCRQIFQGIIAEYIEIQENQLYFMELVSFWEIKPSIANPTISKSIAPLERAVSFENVSFRYPGTSKWILRNININIPKDSSLAIVGLNGAGKTTLIKLLSRLYDPSEGRILWDDVDIREFDINEYRENLSIAFQDHVRYQLSVKENINIGSLLDVDESWMQKVLSFLGLDKLVSGLPNGVDNLLGRQFHVHGAELSGGQWQRVAVGRALYKAKVASVLVLDEPTSAMDASQEALLFGSIEEWKANSALVLISHRLSSVRHCNTIIVLNEGGICEIGNHDSLMRLNGFYHNLFTIQAQGYEMDQAELPLTDVST